MTVPDHPPGIKDEFMDGKRWDNIRLSDSVLWSFSFILVLTEWWTDGSETSSAGLPRDRIGLIVNIIKESILSKTTKPNRVRYTVDMNTITC